MTEILEQTKPAKRTKLPADWFHDPVHMGRVIEKRLAAKDAREERAVEVKDQEFRGRLLAMLQIRLSHVAGRDLEKASQHILAAAGMIDRQRFPE